jgi:asparagine synthase (glutamine-hydrolysing)
MKELEDSNPVSRGLLLPAGEALPLDGVERTLGFVPTWFEVFATMAAKRVSLLADDFKTAFAGRRSAAFFLNQFDVPGQLAGRDPLNQSLYLWTKSTLPNYILVLLGDRMEMAHSIEGRLPFLDHHVVECLRQMPVAMKIRGMTEKFILREATRHVLTDTVYRRQKHPFLSPPVTTLPSERFHTMLQDTLRGPDLAALPFYDAKKVAALLDQLPVMTEAERLAWDPVLMSALSACVLGKRFKV